MNFILKAKDKMEHNLSLLSHRGKQGNNIKNIISTTAIIFAIIVMATCETALTSCNGGKSSPSEASMKDSASVDSMVKDAEPTDGKHTETYLKERVTDIYGRVASMMRKGEGSQKCNEKFLTKSYNALLDKVQAITEKTGDIIIDADHWSMSQDPDFKIKYEPLSVQIKDKDNATADIKIVNYQQEQIARINLKFENGDWYIDDFKSPDNDYSEREMCEKAVAK